MGKEKKLVLKMKGVDMKCVEQRRWSPHILWKMRVLQTLIEKENAHWILNLSLSLSPF